MGYCIHEQFSLFLNFRCVLAVKLGLQQLLPSLDTQSGSAQHSPTATLLHSWGQSTTATLGKGKERKGFYGLPFVCLQGYFFFILLIQNH